MALTTNIRSRVQAILSTTGDLGNPTAQLNWGPGDQTWTSGVGAGAADMIYADTLTVGTSSTTDLDLAGGCVHPITGAVQTFARIKFFGVYGASSNTTVIHVIGKASTGVPFVVALGDGIIVRPNGWFEIGDASATGYVVTATTGDIISITNPSGSVSVTCDIIIIGASA